MASVRARDFGALSRGEIEAILADEAETAEIREMARIELELIVCGMF